MAIEIRELKVTGYINKQENQSGREAGNISRAEIERLTKRIKDECVEEILDILERKNRR